MTGIGFSLIEERGETSRSDGRFEKGEGNRYLN
jgi:hypothetical protein